MATFDAKYKSLRDAGKLHGTLIRAVTLRKQRDANRPLSAAKSNRIADRANAQRGLRCKRAAVPLGTIDALSAIKTAHAKLREWSLGQIAGVIDSPWMFREIGSNSNWSKKSTFQRGIIVQSYATCGDFRRCLLTLNGSTHEIAAPRGYRWDIDANGLRLRANANPRHDYHPTANDLLAGGKHLVARLQDNLVIRRKTEAERKAAARKTAQEQAQQKRILQAAIAEGLSVCLADSCRAGNCEVGTINWGTRHGFSPNGHYTPDQLLAVANGDTKLVLPVIAVALRRHRNEMHQGFSVLADHGR